MILFCFVFFPQNDLGVKKLSISKNSIIAWFCVLLGIPRWLNGKTSDYNAGAQETWIQSLCWEDPLEEKMATHSSILAWREEPGRL